MEIAMIGDSVCTGVYISTPWNTFWRACRSRGGNWFIDPTPPPTGIQSVCHRLEQLTPVLATEYAGIGACVDRAGERQNLFRRILRTRNFSGQIDQLLAARRFADLILIAIGHNNVDWAWRRNRRELEQPNIILEQLSAQFRENFASNLRRLAERACAQHHPIAILVYGLINFEAYFRGRAEAERRRAEDRRLYPHLETTYKYFASFRPIYRRYLIDLAQMVNEQLRSVVDDLNRQLRANPNVQLRYSEALATADLSRAELLHPIDGWHASIKGHNVLAEATFADLGASLEFLGITKPTLCAHQPLDRART